MAPINHTEWFLWKFLLPFPQQIALTSIVVLLGCAECLFQNCAAERLFPACTLKWTLSRALLKIFRLRILCGVFLKFFCSIGTFIRSLTRAVQQHVRSTPQGPEKDAKHIEQRFRFSFVMIKYACLSSALKQMFKSIIPRARGIICAFVFLYRKLANLVYCVLLVEISFVVVLLYNLFIY